MLLRHLAEWLLIAAAPLPPAAFFAVFGSGLIDAPLVALCGKSGSELTLQVLQVAFGAVLGLVSILSLQSIQRVVEVVKWRRACCGKIHAAASSGGLTSGVGVVELNKPCNVLTGLALSTSLGPLWVFLVILLAFAHAVTGPVGHLLYRQVTVIPPNTVAAVAQQDLTPILNSNRLWYGSGALTVNGDPRPLAAVWEGAISNVAASSVTAKVQDADGFNFYLPVETTSGVSVTSANFSVAFGAVYNCLSFNYTGEPPGMSALFFDNSIDEAGNYKVIVKTNSTARTGDNEWEVSTIVWANRTRSGYSTRYIDCRLRVRGCRVALSGCAAASDQRPSCEAPVSFQTLGGKVVMTSAEISTDSSGNITDYVTLNDVASGRLVARTDLVDYGQTTFGDPFEGPILLAQKLESMWTIGKDGAVAVYTAGAHQNTWVTDAWISGSIVENATDWSDPDLLLARAQDVLVRRWNASVALVNSVKNLAPLTVQAVGGSLTVCYVSSKIPSFALAAAVAVVLIIDVAVRLASRGVRMSSLRLFAAAKSDLLMGKLAVDAHKDEQSIAEDLKSLRVRQMGSLDRHTLGTRLEFSLATED
ncbi:hypothetical protein HK405_005048 [Cladochytrium tenue]|nr:hypothetical protein HK405_005048 [Cladochytrium tenue]